MITFVNVLFANCKYIYLLLAHAPLMSYLGMLKDRMKSALDFEQDRSSFFEASHGQPNFPFPSIRIL